VLVQIFSHHDDLAWYSEAVEMTKRHLKDAIIIGGNTPSAISEGQTVNQGSVIGISFFERSTLRLFFEEVSAEGEIQSGNRIAKNIKALDQTVVGVMVLTTPISLSAVNLLSGIKDESLRCDVFGGSVGNISSGYSILIANDNIVERGVAAIAFSGPDLELNIYNYLGWIPISQEMTITSMEGMTVKEIDNKPAFRIYEHYLGITVDEQFFLNAIEFPIIIRRNGENVARMPNQVLDDGSLLFSADLKEGETIRLAYGDHQTILENSEFIQRDFISDKPSAIFLYSCLCRWYLMGQDVVYETEAFEKIAPTFGLYTAGEIYGRSNKIEYLNSAIVVVGIKEGTSEEGRIDTRVTDSADKNNNQNLPQKNLVTRLTHFIGMVSKELVQANHDLEKMAVTDKLTGLYNRAKIDNTVDLELVRARRYETPFSIVLFDIDHFKTINDTHGHLVGDQVLIDMSTIIQNTTRESDIKGRWGGEEFILILPNTDLKEAENVAETLRKAIEEHEFNEAGTVTASFGVSVFTQDDNADTLLNRSDNALYSVKKSGRNGVCSEKTLVD
jgi:diguanylate cyclase (GGDEF)-like protein